MTLILLLTACTSSSDTGQETVGVTCDTTIPTTWPQDGDMAVYHRDAIAFTLSEPDPTATVVAPFDGVQSTSEDGLTITYRPSGPLEPETDYTVQLDYCRGTPAIRFRTSELGQPLHDDLDLTGSVYQADMAEARYTAGDGVSNVIRALIGDFVLLQIVQASDTAFQLRTALTVEENGDVLQDPCGHTADLPSADFMEAPFFSHGADDVLLTTYDTTMNLLDFTASGTVAPDGSWVGGITMAATLDTREAAVLLDIAPDDICLLADNAGLACEPCADGASYCGTVVLENLDADWTDVQMLEMTEQDPDCEPDTDA